MSLVTDECGEEILLSCVAASNILNDPEKFILESFPGGGSFDQVDRLRLEQCVEDADAFVAIERAGPSADGSYRTMKGIDMSHLISPLESILPDTTETSRSSIGIGDGGNEVLSFTF